MMQILDIEYVINQILPVLELPEESLEIKFIDDQIKENNKIIALSKSGVKTIKKRTCDLTMAVSDFVPILTGKYNFSDLYKRGRIKMQSFPNPYWNDMLHPYQIKALDKVFPKIMTHNNEFCF